MIIHKRFFICLLLFTALSFSFKLYAQNTGGIYLDPNRGEKVYRKTVIMNSNRTESILTNWGTFGKQGDPYSGVWPKGSTHGHVHEMTLMVAAEVTDNTGNTVHITSESYEDAKYNVDPDGTQYWWNPLPGYANEYRRFTRSNGTIDTSSQVAHSADATTWPDNWPGKDNTWQGTWNGYFGQNQFNADDEGLYVIDDFKNKRYAFYPILTDTTKKGLGLQCETRLFQWSHPLAQDLIFIHFQITNVSDNDYNNNIYMGAFADTHPGGLGSSNDEDTYSIPDNMVYAWAHNDIGIWTQYRDIKPGYMAWKYLESPGNPYDGKDNNHNGIVDERRDNDAGTKITGKENIIAAFSAVVDTTQFLKAYNYSSINEVPAVQAGVWWTGDENANWDVRYDDVGADGIGPDDPNYKGPDADGTEGNGKPDQGEPDFGKTDKNESDQIGLTSFYSPLYDTFHIGIDEQVWQFIQPGVFQTPAQNANNLWIFASGPFQLKVKKTERFSVVWAFGFTADNILSNARIAQIIYDNNYKFSKPPSQPILKAFAGDKKVTLYWDNRAENSKDPVYGYDFEGYRLYKGTDPQLSEAQIITDAYGNKTYYQPTVQYDLVDNIKGLHPITLGSETGNGSNSVGIQYYMGNDSGLKYSYVDTAVKNGFTYYYALVAYDRGYFNEEDARDGKGLDDLLGITDRKLGRISPSESSFAFTYNSGVLVSQSVNTAIVVPNTLASNYKAGYIKEADADGIIYWTHADIITSGQIKTTVVDPSRLPKDNIYEISFADTIGNYGETILKSYSIKNVTKDSVVVSKTSIPIDPKTGLSALSWITPAADGIKYEFTNITPDLTKIKALSDWLPGSQTNIGVTLNSLSSPIVPKNMIIEITDTVGSTDSKNKKCYFKIYDKVTGDPIQFTVFKGDNNGHIVANTQLTILAKSSVGGTANIWSIKFTQPASVLVPPAAGDKYQLVCDVPFGHDINFRFTTKESTAGKSDSKIMNQITVVPNPYIVSAKWERASAYQGRGERKIYFMHLPAQCTIKIFTQNGTLLKTIQHMGSVSSGSESWDMTTSEGLEVAFGIYVYHIESPGIGQKIGTFGIIN